MKVSTLIGSVASIAAVATVAAATEAEAASSNSSSSGYVNASSLNVRSGPGTNHAVLGSLSHGAVVQITGQSGSWYQIQYKNQQAYVHGDYISSSPTNKSGTTYTVNASALNVRTEPNTTSSIIGVLPNGQKVDIQSEQNGWYVISFNGKTGFIKKDFVSSSSSNGNVDSVTPSYYYVTCSALRVRSGPGTSYDIVGIMSNGQQVQVVGKTTGWYKVRYAGKEGFVSDQYIQPSGSKSDSSQTTGLFQRPASGTTTSTFGMRWGTMHYGIDIAAPGNVQVHAAAAGTVTRSYFSASYGNVVFITHKLGGQTYTTVYAHLKSRAVQVGEVVSQGQYIGYMGNTGDSHGQHLHFELHKGEWNLQKTNAVDPLPYLQ